MKGKYFLTVMDGEIFSTDSYEIYVLFNCLFRGFNPVFARDKQFPKIRGSKPDWNVITFRGKVTHRKFNGKYVRVNNE